MVYGLSRRWQRDGTWAEILASLQARADAAALITWDVPVDSPDRSRPPARRTGVGGRDLELREVIYYLSRYMRSI